MITRKLINDAQTSAIHANSTKEWPATAGMNTMSDTEVTRQSMMLEI